MEGARVVGRTVADSEGAPVNVRGALGCTHQRPQGDRFGRFAQLDPTARSAKCPNETGLRQSLNDLGEVCTGEPGRFGNFVDWGEFPWWPAGQVESRANRNLGSMSVKHRITQYKIYGPCIPE
jgi:hypothetical protein